MANTATGPRCDMTEDCQKPITHVDSAGYIYCADHGLQRRAYEPCRKLRAWELRRNSARRANHALLGGYRHGS